MQQRYPVVLIHGIFRQSYVFNLLCPYLTKLGFEVHRFDLTPHGGQVGIDELAVQIKDYVEKEFSPDQQFHLVGFSMGGLVSRYYLQRLGGVKRVKRFITLSSPHNGTWTAYFKNVPGCVQMRPGSRFLRDLNRDIEGLEQVDFVSLWTPFDLLIVPASSAILPVGKAMRLWVWMHDRMTWHPTAMEAIAQALKD